MKTLILSANTGGGHNSCSNAIKTYYESKGECCDIVDGLSFISKSASKIISGGDIKIYRYFPILFNIGYKYSEKHSFVFSRSFIVYKALVSGTTKLYNYIMNNGYDTVICTHAFTALCLTGVVIKYHPDIKTAFVATDYTCYPCVQHSILDRYFIPDETLIPVYEGAGVMKHNIVPSGIPVREQIMTNTDRESARKQMNIPLNQKHIIIMGGSCGCGPLSKVTELFATDESNDCFVSVVCGTNEKLKESLQKKIGDNKNISILGFVQNMSLLMDSADLLITKPGGICITEAAQKRLPMVFIDSVCGCEEYNRDFFLERGMALAGSDETEIYNACKSIIHDDGKLMQMSESYSALTNNKAPETIFNTLSELNGQEE